MIRPNNAISTVFIYFSKLNIISLLILVKINLFDYIISGKTIHFFLFIITFYYIKTQMFTLVSLSLRKRN